ncbi:hypothetical protein AVEN_235163-1 [Araneus ventricosus]|uniref:Uncharacterized protein n=1 Tax=Araneus ventricosus TaxID=182803 RepID=A0A4Y2H3L0_ARAVE|nr:hypothetical protein AVEN_235163-1 [Araneus ventricosus]
MDEVLTGEVLHYHRILPQTSVSHLPPMELISLPGALSAVENEEKQFSLHCKSQVRYKCGSVPRESAPGRQVPPYIRDQSDFYLRCSKVALTSRRCHTSFLTRVCDSWAWLDFLDQVGLEPPPPEALFDLTK